MLNGTTQLLDSIQTAQVFDDSYTLADVSELLGVTINAETKNIADLLMEATASVTAALRDLFFITVA